MNRFYFSLTGLIILAGNVSCDKSSNPVNTDDGVESFLHTRNPGTSAGDFLLNDTYTELLVEVQYMPGYRPTDDALDQLQFFLEEHLNKTSVTIRDPREIPAGGQNRYSASDVRELEEKYRENFSEGKVLASYNLFVDGEYDQANVLGIAYYNTSNAFFGKTIHSTSGSPPLSPSREKIEGTVLRHEYGHLLGLVDNGVEMQNHHRENGAHCSEKECLMYATVNTTDFFANLFDGSVPGLDEFCAEDIRTVRNE